MAKKKPVDDSRARSDDYDRIKERSRERNAEASAAGRDIGELPAIVNPRRRKKCERNFQVYCEEYFPNSFALAWSDDHKKVIRKIERSVLEGSLFAVAMPRGSGKTTLAETASIWAHSYGHRRFIALLGSDAKSAEAMLDSIKTEYEVNDLLFEDFPEICYPIRCLEGIVNRCAGQTFKGERTHITWTAREVVLPTIAGSKASGAVLRVAGLLGRIRGMKYKTADGQTLRPDLVIPDDPQTDQSANSVSQCERRERILAGAVLGLAGPKKKIAGIMPCTVIREGDMVDRILDPKIHPEWNGERCKLLNSFPKRMDLWDKYRDVLEDSMRAGEGMEKATAVYLEHQAEMDEGAKAAWPARFNPDEASAIQHAMNLYFRDEYSFFAEYQNEPKKLQTSELPELTAAEIAERTSKLAHGVVPIWATRLVAGYDVQASGLFYAVIALAEDFTGTVIDYDTWPKQSRRYFTLRDMKATFATHCKAKTLVGQIREALDTSTEEILGLAWKREDGAVLRIEKCAIDANYQDDAVYEFCLRSKYPQVVIPSDGMYLGPNATPIAERKKKIGERVGLNWYIPVASGNRPVRKLVFDTNFWKTFTHERLRVPSTDSSSLTLYGSSPKPHRLFSEHFTAEFRHRAGGKREIDEWKQKPGKPDNHFFDATYNAMVAGSVLGCKLPELAGASKTRRSRVSFAEMQRERKANRAPPQPDSVADPEPQADSPPQSSPPDPATGSPSANSSASQGRKRVSFAEMQKRARERR